MEKKHDEFSFYDLFIPLTTKKILIYSILIGFFVFFNALFGNFVWDDRTFIVFNPEIKNMDLGQLLGANMFNNVNAGQYRFFVALYFTFLYNFFGETTFFYHFFQLIIHITNTMLVFLIFSKCLKKELSFFLSLVFLVHPIQVESVAYIASSGNPLFVFFGLIAIFLSMGRITSKKIFFIFLSLLFSLFSKETGIIFIFLVLLYQLIFVKKDIYRWFLYSFATIALYSFIRFFIANVYFTKVELAPITQLTFSERILNMPAVLFYYIKTFFLPIDLIIEQYWIIKQINFQTFFFPLIILISLLGIWIFYAIQFYKKGKHMFFFFIFFSMWFFSGMAAYSQIVSLNMTVADRWFYFPIIGLLAMLGMILQYMLIWKNTRILLILGMIIIITLSIRTMIRNANWQDPITLYTHDSQILENYDIENTLGSELSLLGRHKEALPHFKKSVQLFPHETNLINLGITYEVLGDKKNALIYYEKALAAKSFNEVPKPHRHHNITYIKPAILYLKTNPEKALSISAMGLNDYPNNPDLWHIKAHAAYALNKKKEAYEAAKTLSTLVPGNRKVQELLENIEKNQPIQF